MCETLIRKPNRDYCKKKETENRAPCIYVCIDLVKFGNEHCFYLDGEYAFFILNINQLNVVGLCCFMDFTCLLL